MTQPQHVQQQPSFMVPVITGAVFALLVISFFVFGADNPPAEWGKYWQIRPLIITPLAGAIGGTCYAFLNYQSNRGFNRTLAVILGLVIYFVGLWLGTVLGLAGTMWN
ncbi:potassium transporter KefB [Pontibacter fetidus]|uniref:Potassium transporter KefB n=1 Tax=Pontibacter fetidus TaxID=2700082 RepID=A0A6B2H0I7_9BACT|nr:potassium transporter KefB [Pontibacter fetidus]NDK56595.1 potassium transporter KefB [Pontibacter fetidus]